MPCRGRFGLVAYARILAAVTTQDRSPRDVAIALDMGAQSVREVLWGMVKLGLVHVREWAPPQIPRSSFLTPMMAAGEGPSAPYPVSIRRSAGGATGGARPELIHFATIVRELRNGATRRDLHERCGTAEHNLRPLLRAMRALGIARVAEWQGRDDGCGKPAEVWHLGAGRDAPRPPRLTRSERNLRNRRRRQARIATLRIVHAVAGSTTIVACGRQAYHQLGQAA